MFISTGLGRITTAPVMTTEPHPKGGTYQVCTFRLACRDTATSMDYFDFKVYGKLARYVSENLSAGIKIMFDAKIKSPDPENCCAYAILRGFEFAEGKREGEKKFAEPEDIRLAESFAETSVA